MSDSKDSFDFGVLLYILFLIWFFFYLGTVGASFIEVSKEAYSEPILNTWISLNDSPLHPSIEGRFVVFLNSSVEIFIKRSDYESIPFPDRPDVIRSVGKTWCDSASSLFLPTVTFKDIRSGEKLDSHSCFWGDLREILPGN